MMNRSPFGGDGIRFIPSRFLESRPGPSPGPYTETEYSERESIDVSECEARFAGVAYELDVL